MIKHASDFHFCDLFTGAEYKVTLFDMHSEDRRGRRRMAVWIAANSPTFPGQFRPLMHSRNYYPAPSISCDGEEAARHALDFLPFDDFSTEELELIQ